jgi:prevent-host-death family protein
MQRWSVADARAQFDDFLDSCIAHGPQGLTQRGQEVAVLVSLEEWKQLQITARPTLKELLLADTARTDELTPPRRRARR